MLKNHLNYLKNSTFECFFNEYDRLLFFSKKINFFFSKHLMMESLSLEEENISKDIRNLFRLKKEQNCTTIKEIRNLFKLEKEPKAIKEIILNQ